MRSDIAAAGKGSHQRGPIREIDIARTADRNPIGFCR